MRLKDHIPHIVKEHKTTCAIIAVVIVVLAIL